MSAKFSIDPEKAARKHKNRKKKVKICQKNNKFCSVRKIFRPADR